MAEHQVPRELVDLLVAELISRSDLESVEGSSEALAFLSRLPEIESGAELEIDFYCSHPPASAKLHLTADWLSLVIADDEGDNEVYYCEAGMYPRVDSDVTAWIDYFQSLPATRVAITCSIPQSEHDSASPVELTLADVATPNYRSCVTLQLSPEGALRMHVYDTGDAPKAAFGGDFDRWVDVRADAKDALLMELLKEKFAGDADAVSHFRDFCQRCAVPHDFGVY